MSIQIKRKEKESLNSNGKALLCVFMAPFMLMAFFLLSKVFDIRSSRGISVPFILFLLDLALVIWSMIRLKKQAISAPLQLAWALTILLLPIAGPISFLFLNPTEKKA